MEKLTKYVYVMIFEDMVSVQNTLNFWIDCNIDHFVYT